MQANCGLLIDKDTLDVVGDTMTIKGNTDIVKKYSKICGGLCYDGDNFKFVNDVMTLIDDDKDEFDNIIISTCGAKFDGDYFSIEEGKLKLTH